MAEIKFLGFPAVLSIKTMQRRKKDSATALASATLADTSLHDFFAWHELMNEFCTSSCMYSAWALLWVLRELCIEFALDFVGVFHEFLHQFKSDFLNKVSLKLFSFVKVTDHKKIRNYWKVSVYLNLSEVRLIRCLELSFFYWRKLTTRFN